MLQLITSADMCRCAATTMSLWSLPIKCVVLTNISTDWIWLRVDLVNLSVHITAVRRLRMSVLQHIIFGNELPVSWECLVMVFCSQLEISAIVNQCKRPKSACFSTIDINEQSSKYMPLI